MNQPQDKPPAAQTEGPAAFFALKPYYIPEYIGIVVAIYMISIPSSMAITEKRV
ncbi:MAG: hypothetical protein M3264_06115 [Thermoproteota archaeon]|nr:hypothetical protein [Thermoproteota archaeon]